jgi:uncharacterized protein
MRGFLSGISLGAVVAVLGAVMVSLVLPLPEPPKVADRAPQEAPMPETDENADLGEPKRDGDLVEAAPVMPQDAETESDSLTALSDADTQPADKPEVGAVTGSLNKPEVTAEDPAPTVAASEEAPVVAPDPAAAPTVPEPDVTASISTEPAQPPAPEVIEEDTGLGAVSETEATAPQAPTAPVVDDALPDVGQATADEPQAVAEAEAAPEPEIEAAPEQEQEGEPAPEPKIAVAPEPESEPETASAPDAAPAVEAEPAVQPDTAPETQDPEPETAPRIAALPQAGSATEGQGPRIGTPVVRLTDRNLAPEEVAEEEIVVQPGKPIEAFAAEFENPDGRPLMSILLIDDGEALGFEALLDFPYPISIALNPQSADAPNKMAQYRAAGFEVVLIADMDANAQPQDAETSLAVWMERLPEVVAVLEGTGSGIQGNRALSDQVTDVIKATGLGLITQNSGLNTVQKLAARDGVPSAVVFRDFDGAGQTPAVIRRFLDQAAFRAGQEGAVIMLGRMRPDTISALLLWGLQDRASRVALAPVSASLLSNLPTE